MPVPRWLYFEKYSHNRFLSRIVPLFALMGEAHCPFRFQAKVCELDTCAELTRHNSRDAISPFWLPRGLIAETSKSPVAKFWGGGGWAKFLFLTLAIVFILDKLMLLRFILNI
jgi:hypothetical protein